VITTTRRPEPARASDPDALLVDRHRDTGHARLGELLAQAGRAGVLDGDLAQATGGQDIGEEPAGLGEAVDDEDPVGRRDQGADPAQVRRQLAPQQGKSGRVAVPEVGIG